MRLLDPGAGTGMRATAFTSWYGIDVAGVEPSQAMRARSSCPHTLPGHASAIPLGPGATKVPQALKRPGRMAVAPRNALAKAGRR